MGGPNASKAMRTTSIARTTPAQKPRGFSKSNVFPSVFARIPDTIEPAPQTLPTLNSQIEQNQGPYLPVIRCNFAHKICTFSVHDPHCGDSNKLPESTGMVNVRRRNSRN